MKQVPKVHTTASQGPEHKAANPFSKFFTKHPSLGRFTAGSLVIAGLIGGFTAKPALAQQPAAAAEWQHKIDYYDLKTQTEGLVEIFSRYLNTRPPNHAIKIQGPNGYIAESFQDDERKVTIIKNGELLGVYIYMGSGFLGLSRDPHNHNILMAQVTGVLPGSPLIPGCALQPDGSPIFVSKTHMFVVDWKDDGKVSIFNLGSDALMPSVKQLDPHKFIIKEYSQENDGAGLIILSSELNGLFFVSNNPEKNGFYPRGTNAFSNVVKSLLTQDEQNLIASR